jgi:hypothetical protein
MGKSKSGSQRTTAGRQAEIPDWYKPYVERGLERVEDQYGQPHQPYEGQRLAGVDPSQITALGALGGTGAGSIAEKAQAGLTEGMDLLRQGATGTTDQEEIQSYINPYMQNVTDIAKREAIEESQRQSQRNAALAAKSGAFGGTRGAVVEGMRMGNLGQQVGDIQAKGLAAAYEDAQKRMAAARGRQLQAAPTMGKMGIQQQKGLQEGYKGALTAGQQRRDLSQEPLDIAYQSFLEQRAHPRQQIADYLQGIQGLAPRNVVDPYSYQDTSRAWKTYTPFEQGSKAVSNLFGAKGMGWFGAGGKVPSYADGGGVAPNQPYEEQVGQPSGLTSLGSGPTLALFNGGLTSKNKQQGVANPWTLEKENKDFNENLDLVNSLIRKESKAKNVNKNEVSDLLRRKKKMIADHNYIKHHFKQTRDMEGIPWMFGQPNFKNLRKRFPTYGGRKASFSEIATPKDKWGIRDKKDIARKTEASLRKKGEFATMSEADKDVLEKIISKFRKEKKTPISTTSILSPKFDELSEAETEQFNWPIKLSAREKAEKKQTAIEAQAEKDKDFEKKWANLGRPEFVSHHDPDYEEPTKKSLYRAGKDYGLMGTKAEQAQIDAEVLKFNQNQNKADAAWRERERQYKVKENVKKLADKDHKAFVASIREKNKRASEHLEKKLKDRERQIKIAEKQAKGTTAHNEAVTKQIDAQNKKLSKDYDNAVTEHKLDKIFYRKKTEEDRGQVDKINQYKKEKFKSYERLKRERNRLIREYNRNMRNWYESGAPQALAASRWASRLPMGKEQDVATIAALTKPYEDKLVETTRTAPDLKTYQPYGTGRPTYPTSPTLNVYPRPMAHISPYTQQPYPEAAEITLMPKVNAESIGLRRELASKISKKDFIALYHLPNEEKIKTARKNLMSQIRYRNAMASHELKKAGLKKLEIMMVNLAKLQTQADKERTENLKNTTGLLKEYAGSPFGVMTLTGILNEKDPTKQKTQLSNFSRMLTDVVTMEYENLKSNLAQSARKTGGKDLGIKEVKE